MRNDDEKSMRNDDLKALVDRISEKTKTGIFKSCQMFSIILGRFT